jgi:hypothetical protein
VSAVSDFLTIIALIFCGLMMVSFGICSVMGFTSRPNQEAFILSGLFLVLTVFTFFVCRELLRVLGESDDVVPADSSPQNAEKESSINDDENQDNSSSAN